ncbi:hypothetical protein BGZ92_004761 [Podila epicladia]|nr:hypothetical protein BGZ92_004761 [Podila epicladia]
MHADIKPATTPLGKRDTDSKGDIEDITSIEASKHHSHDDQGGDSVTPPNTTSATTTVTTTTTTPMADNPVFPPKSAFCQQCQVHYPKLVECNQIANWTLATLPRLPPPTSADDEAFVHGLGHPRPSDKSSSDITVIMPFLQCICPGQGVLGLKSCLTCFKLSSQASNNFLQELVLQNVTTSLKAYTSLCIETVNGTFVPPPGRKGASASQSSFSSLTAPSWTTFLVVLCLVGLGLGS